MQIKKIDVTTHDYNVGHHWCMIVEEGTLFDGGNVTTQ